MIRLKTGDEIMFIFQLYCYMYLPMKLVFFFGFPFLYQDYNTMLTAVSNLYLFDFITI